MRLALFLLPLAAVLALAVPGSDAKLQPLRDCDEAECAATVAECAASCWCDLPVCECCVECAICMGDLWPACCDCFNICGPSIDSRAALEALNVTAASALLKHIQQTIFDDETDNRTGIFELPVAKTSVQTGQVGLSSDAIAAPALWKNVSTAEVSKFLPKATDIPCELIAYINCMSFNACVSQCQSVGSAGYVWFNNGCCECYGPFDCIDPSWPPYPLCQNCH